MVTTQDDGIFTRTAAFNFLKDLIGIKRRDTLNRQVFNLCFKENDGYFVLTKSDSTIKEIFQKNRIRERNQRYWSLKKSNPEEAKRHFEETFLLLNRSLSLQQQLV